ncbi:alpha-hydroxy acid oxidase [Rhizobium sp. RU36D]|uniref:alpha-hydroxy acid oxidase n=1 Tax=Rhizobium sp. RU36D TaxID=1907415 RepID=UPI0009D7ECC3|nr:alpha-hydroxy acid oxidase [Rhizobium sp. RU36D]SMC86588.1 L-lactate dehydrogenase (cytochrome) [Rhizobium sp. RU36D]
MADGAREDARTVRLMAALRRQFPAVEDLERRARRRMPSFAFDFLQGGAGDESGLRRNRSALQAVEVVPRYGVDVTKVDPSVELFGHRYAVPIGISPIGFDGMMWPGATEYFARAAQAQNIPYMVGTLACATIEQVVSWAPDVTWFQLYPMASDDHRNSREMADRAQRAGARVLVVTLDVPIRPKRPRDLRNGLIMPFNMTPRIALAAALAPHWLRALSRKGMPTFANMAEFSGTADRQATANFVRTHIGGGFPWDEISRLRDRWTGPMLVKGILHPADAEKAMRLGLDGVVVSNHGGRQFDAAPATIDVLPEIVRTVGGRGTMLFDSGIVSGVDILRAVALGAHGCFAGRAFMLGLGALGDHGAAHVAQSFIEEYRIALGQCGLTSTAAARHAPVRHPGAWTAEDFAPAA